MNMNDNYLTRFEIYYIISNNLIGPRVFVYFGGCNKPGSFNPYFYGQRDPAYLTYNRINPDTTHYTTTTNFDTFLFYYFVTLSTYSEIETRTSTI